jgi:hypothetical protein
MAKSYKNMTAQQENFARAVATCHSATDSSGKAHAGGFTFGKCMKEQMTGRRVGRKGRKGKKKR